MSGASSEQLRDLLYQRDRENDSLRDSILEAETRFEQIRLIAQDHATCECSCAVMVLEVLRRA